MESGNLEAKTGSQRAREAAGDAGQKCRPAPARLGWETNQPVTRSMNRPAGIEVEMEVEVEMEMVGGAGGQQPRRLHATE